MSRAAFYNPSGVTGTSGVSSGVQSPNKSLSDVIPGLDQLSTTASGNILDLLSGNLSPGIARNANAYWGAASGQPATGELGTFIGNRGTDLFHSQAMGQKQQGLQDLLSLIGTYSGNLAPSANANLQNDQFLKSLAQSGSQFGANLAQNQSQFLANLGQNQNQFDSSLAQNQAQFDAQNALQQFNSQLNLLGMGLNLAQGFNQNPFANLIP